MGANQYIGMGVWLAQKTDQLEDAWDVYQATQSSDAALSVSIVIFEITAGLSAGFAVTGIVGMIQKTGLDRVFDSIRKNKSYSDYTKNQEIWKNISNYSAGQATDAIIDMIKDYINSGALDPTLQDIYDLINTSPSNTNKTQTIDKIKELVNKAAKTTSPLILDLDGDGVETLAQSANNVYFDHDANGFAERSGWVATDDGLLVRDINGNGEIDSGRELFGNNTLLANGQLAENGFTALVDLDSNNDGVINAADTAFISLRVWKDTNSNGITDEGELLTMTQAGVQSISTSYTDKGTTGTEDAQGNQHRQTGSYLQQG